jgi:superfamily II DNA or RNA helicase
MSNEARASWQNQFAYREERAGDDGAEVSAGLRPPQIGAIHAAIGHWRAQDDPATVVMPTGTGKTEAMLALLVAEQIPRLFVVVPSDALRQQIAHKFLSLGLLPALGVTSPQARLPVVAILSENLASPADVDQLVPAANVIITTAALIATCSPEVQQRIAHHCSHLLTAA